MLSNNDNKKQISRAYVKTTTFFYPHSGIFGLAVWLCSGCKFVSDHFYLSLNLGIEHDLFMAEDKRARGRTNMKAI